MSTLLHLDASVRPEGLSRELSGRFADRWCAADDDRTVVRRDLAADPLPHVARGPADHLMYRTATGEAPDEVRRCHELIDELSGADRLLMSMPMYNFTVPSTVKAWIDHIAWPGLTFDPAAGRGLFDDVPAVVIVTRSGGYGPSSPKADFNFLEPYLTKVLGFLGIHDVEFIVSELRLFARDRSLDPQLTVLADQGHAEALARIDELTPVA